MITVDFERGKFVISCLPHEADLVANLPNRRFQKKRAIWTAPNTRLNIEAINSWPALPGYICSPAAKRILDATPDCLIQDVPWPDNYKFKTDPFPHQLDACKKIFPLSGWALFMDIGTGKTKVAIDVASAHYFMGHIKRVVVICLVSIKRNWEKEIRLHSPITLANVIQVNTKKKGIKELEYLKDSPRFGWAIVGVESLSAGKAFELVSAIVDQDTLVIVDESSRIKNHKANRTDRAIELGSNAGYRGIMTGTPITQGAGDLYSQFEFLDPNIIGIGDFYSFRNRYVILGGHEQKQIIGYKKMEELTNTLAPFIFQVRKRDVLKDLPPFTHVRHEVQMTKEQTDLYKELKERMRVEYEDKTLVVKNVMNMMQRFTEIAGGHISYETENPDPFTCEKKPVIYQKKALKGNPKLDLLITLLEDMDQTAPVVVWVNGKMEIQAVVDRIAKRFGMGKIGVLHGGIKEDERHQQVEAFQRGELIYMVGNPAVGGIGLNMTAASTMFYFNRDFSLETCIQSEGRIDRIGQENPMTYIDLVCKSTIDEYVLNALQGKSDFAEAVRSSFDDGSFLDMV